MNLTENALRVLQQRYLLKDQDGKITETPEEMFRRVAKAVAYAENLYKGRPQEWEEIFYNLKKYNRNK